MTDTAISNEIATVVDSYLQAFNETDAGRRGQLIAAAWAPEGKFWDPLMQASGHAELGAIAVAAQQQFPGHRFSRTTGIDSHHEFVRFGWQLAGPDGSTVVKGTDVGIVDSEGRLTRIVGFFGEPPATDA